MLVLSRKTGESIKIGDGIRVTVVRIANGSVRLGVSADKSIPVRRPDMKKDRKNGNAK